MEDLKEIFIESNESNITWGSDHSNTDSTFKSFINMALYLKRLKYDVISRFVNVLSLLQLKFELKESPSVIIITPGSTQSEKNILYDDKHKIINGVDEYEPEESFEHEVYTSMAKILSIIYSQQSIVKLLLIIEFEKMDNVSFNSIDIYFQKLKEIIDSLTVSGYRVYIHNFYDYYFVPI